MNAAIAAPIASDSESRTGRAGERYPADGIAVSVNGTADGKGKLVGTFKIPPKVPAGAKTVSFTGKGGTRSSAVFVGQGELTVTTLRQINTVSTYWVDPLAQTFVMDRNVQLAGVDVWFTVSGGDARLQVREVQNGVPTRVILAEADIPKAAMKVPSGEAGQGAGGHTRVLLPAPLSLAASVEYAFVVLCDDAETALAVAELSKFDPHVQKWVTSQPYQVGTLLSSSNGSTWTAHQDKDLTFRLCWAIHGINGLIRFGLPCGLRSAGAWRGMGPRFWSSRTGGNYPP